MCHGSKSDPVLLCLASGWEAMGSALGVWAHVAVVEVGELGRFCICFQGGALGITDGLDGMPERGHLEGLGGLEPRAGT